MLKVSSYRNCYFARIFPLVIALGTLVGARIAWSQQNQPGLQITSPADGAVVAPGQSVSITVVAVNNASVVTVFVLSPLGGTSTASSLPAQLSMSIPETVALRKYDLTATGGTNGGQVLYSNPVTIDVERPDLPIQLTSLQGRIVFTGITGPSPLTIYAKFLDGTNLDVTESSNLAFTSSNPTIATVDANGMVKPVAQGSTTIIATYAQGGQSVSVSIPVTVPRPTVKASPAAMNFEDQSVGTSSIPQTLTLTNAGNDPQLKVGPLGVQGDFAETDDCTSLSPIGPGATCTASITYTPSMAGAETGILYVSDSRDQIAMQIPLSGTGIGQPTTTTTIASSANPSVYGQATTLSSSVNASSGTGTPTGSVAFDDGTNALGTASLSDAQAAFTVSSLNVGSHSISAAYSGDSNDFPGAVVTTPRGVNNRNVVIGQYQNADFSFHGFIYDGTLKTFLNTFDCPSGGPVIAGINDQGDRVEGCSNGSFEITAAGQITPISFPGASFTSVNSINNSGQIVGIYCVSSDNIFNPFPCHGFLFSNGNYQIIDYPGSMNTHAM